MNEMSLFLMYPEFKHVDDETMKIRLNACSTDVQNYYDFCVYHGQKKHSMILWLLQKFPHKFDINENVVHAASYGNFKLCSYYLENYKEKIRNESRLSVIRNLKFIVKINDVSEKDMIYFLKCCYLLNKDFNGVCEKCIRIFAKVFERKIQTSIRNIISWWIPICYDVKRECGKRMMERSWDRVEEMYKNIKI